MALPSLSHDVLRTDLPDRDFLDRLKEFLAGTHLAVREEQRQCMCGGAEACRKISGAMDTVLSVLHDRARGRFRASAPDMSHRMAVVAVGGYGRNGILARSDY